MYTTLQLVLSGITNEDHCYVDEFIIPNLIKRCNQIHADLATSSSNLHADDSPSISNNLNCCSDRTAILNCQWIPLYDTLEITFHPLYINMSTIYSYTEKLLLVYNERRPGKQGLFFSSTVQDIRILSGKTSIIEVPLGNRGSGGSNNTPAHQAAPGIIPSGNRGTGESDLPSQVTNPGTITSHYFEVSGMSCAHCASGIENKLLNNPQLPGIKYATVSCVTNTAHILLDSHPPVCGVRDIQECIHAMGYSARYIPSHSQSGMGQASPTSTAELDQWGYYLSISLLFGIPVILLHLSMGLSPGLMRDFTHTTSTYYICNNSSISINQVIMLLLTLPIQVLVGYKYYRGAFISAYISRSYGMDSLIAIGTTLIFAYSLVELIYACHSHTVTNDPSAAPKVFFEASAMLLTFVTVGKYIEAYTKSRTANAIAKLLECQPKQVTRLYIVCICLYCVVCLF